MRNYTGWHKINFKEKLWSLIDFSVKLEELIELIVEKKTKSEKYYDANYRQFWIT